MMKKRKTVVWGGDKGGGGGLLGDLLNFGSKGDSTKN
jgi:hypothetical protein